MAFDSSALRHVANAVGSTMALNQQLSLHSFVAAPIRDNVQGGRLGLEPRCAGFDSQVSDQSGRRLKVGRLSGGQVLAGSIPAALTRQYTSILPEDARLQGFVVWFGTGRSVPVLKTEQTSGMWSKVGYSVRIRDSAGSIPVSLTASNADLGIQSNGPKVAHQE